MKVDHYKIRKDSQKIIIGAHAFPEEDYGVYYIQIKLSDIQVVLETLKNIDHDPSEEGNDEMFGRVVNKLLLKQDDNYKLFIRTEYNPWGYHDPKNLWIFSYWNDKSIKSNRICLSYWTYEELKTEVDRLVDAIETALKE